MKNTTSISRADVLRTTWQIVRKSRLRFGVALKRAWAASRAKAALATTDERGIWLTFRKVDGTVRTVLGTRNMAYIPAEHQPKSTGKPDAHTIAYFDIWDGAWKCFRADSLLRVG